MRLHAAVDTNPDPKIVEIDLVAREADVDLGNGERVRAWTYNGTLPGPQITAQAGDRLIVHFKNELTAPTTVHWHGVQVPNAMDGVPWHTQPSVLPGDSFTYDFRVDDPGLFWYHPHVMSAAQVGFGLYGTLLVKDPADGVGVADELVLVLSDIGIADGRLESPDSGGALGMAFGREGNRVLVNGHTNATLTVRDGAPQRWRVVNAAKSRYFLLDLEGETFTIIGRDGGLQARPERMDTVVITPGERLDLIVAPRRPADGGTRVLRSGLYNRGFGSVEFRQVEELVTLSFADLPPYPPASLALPSRRIEPIATAGATRLAIDITLSTRDDGTVEYGINGKAFADEHTSTARVGETQIWNITNHTKWSHPFHLHGFFFQVLDANGVPVQPLAWKDTVDVPFEQSVSFVVRFDDRPGMWMYHCHVLDHADGGLMGMVQLLPKE